MTSSERTSLTFSTAFRTPLPKYRSLSPSRSSTASFSPVEAPLGMAALPTVPSSSVSSTSTVGFPRESRISPAHTSVMVVFMSNSRNDQEEKNRGTSWSNLDKKWGKSKGEKERGKMSEIRGQKNRGQKSEDRSQLVCRSET